MTLSNNHRSLTTLFLDLDDTLYPRGSGVWQAIAVRINQFLVEVMHFNEEEALSLRDQYLHEYGTTLGGLMSNNAVDPIEYLDYVHDISVEDYLESHPGLKSMLQSIRLEKGIFTNANEAHARRVLAALEIEAEIDFIVDITKLDYANKPLPASYARALALANNNLPEATMLVDDRWDNVQGAREFGMIGVWLENDGKDCPEQPCITDILELEMAIARFQDGGTE